MSDISISDFTRTSNKLSGISSRCKSSNVTSLSSKSVYPERVWGPFPKNYHSRFFYRYAPLRVSWAACHAILMKGEGANQQDHRCINMSCSRSNVQLIFFFFLLSLSVTFLCSVYTQKIAEVMGVSFCHL